jgi:hypothetical protein
VEDMRAAYARSEEFLQTTLNEEASEKKLKDSFRKQLLLVAGFSQEDVDKKDLSSISGEEFQEILKGRFTGFQMPNGSKQKVVSIDEADGYLSKGWEYVAKLSDNKIVIKAVSANP